MVARNVLSAREVKEGGGVEGEGGALILNRAKVILLCKFPKTSFAWLIGTGRQTSFS